MTEVSICNMALISLGANTIASLSDDNDIARKLNAVYADLRDNELRSYPWNFAIRWAELAQVSETPVNSFTYAYQLPTGWLKIIRLKGTDQRNSFRIENGKLYTDLSSVTIEYITQVTDATQFDIAFSVALAARIAAELAYSITRSRDLEKQKMEEYLLKISKAKALDSQEGKADIVDRSYWLDERSTST